MSDSTGSSRTTLTVRFRNPETHAALREAARELGISMSELAEKAMEHELAVIDVALRRKLRRCAERLKSHGNRAGGDDAAAFARAEVSEDDPLHSRSTPSPSDPLDVTAAFGDS